MNTTKKIDKPYKIYVINRIQLFHSIDYVNDKRHKKTMRLVDFSLFLINIKDLPS